MYEDKILVCKECGNEFTFTAGEQEFYAERGFQNEPQRCKPCRDARKNAARGPVSTSLLCAPLAAVRRRFPLSPSLTGPSTAASASRRCARSRDNDLLSFWLLQIKIASAFADAIFL